MLENDNTFYETLRQSLITINVSKLPHNTDELTNLEDMVNENLDQDNDADVASTLGFMILIGKRKINT